MIISNIDISITQLNRNAISNYKQDEEIKLIRVAFG